MTVASDPLGLGKALAASVKPVAVSSAPDSSPKQSPPVRDKRDPDLAVAKKQSRGAKSPATRDDMREATSKFGALARKVSWAWDKDGIYCYTHRARSKSYASADKVPVRDVKFIESTG